MVTTKVMNGVFALWAATRKIVLFSGYRRKRVLDAKSGNLLAWVQIFREETCRAAFDAGGDNERIPEPYPRFSFDTECHRKLGWSGCHAPGRSTGSHKAARSPARGTGNSSRYVYLEFPHDRP